MRLATAGLALALLTACGGGGTPDPLASPSSEVPTASPTTKKPRPKPTKTATPKPSPTPTTPPPVTGDPVGTDEALLRLSSSAEKVSGTDCAKLAPGMNDVSCAAVKTDAGSLVAVTGRIASRKALRLLMPVEGGYVIRYEGVDPSRSWRNTKVFAAPLTGSGVDGVVFFVGLTDGAATYDVLTWVRGGPLVLRGHRGPLADGRLAAAGGVLEEYERAVDGSFVKRRVAWDGRRFRASAGVRSATAPPR